MWELVVYQIVPWDSLIHVLRFGVYDDLSDCMQLYSMVVQEISKAQLIGSYIPMCVRI